MSRFRLSPKMRRARLWILSAVIIGLLPILWAVIHNADLGKPADWQAVFATGDALVLSAALAGGCVYELLIRSVPEGKEDTRNALIVSALVLVLGAVLWFSDMRGSPEGATHTALWTLVYLVVTVVICVRALYLTYDSEAMGSAQGLPAVEPTAATTTPQPS